MAAICDCTRSDSGLTPVLDLGIGTYEGFSGGLYGGGSNVRPCALNSTVLTATAGIAPDANGQIVVAFAGDDTGNSLYVGFLQVAALHPGIFSPALRLINISTPAYHLNAWAGTATPVNITQKITATGVSPADVQCVIFGCKPNTQNYATDSFAVRHARTVKDYKSVFARIHVAAPNAVIATTDVQYADYQQNSLAPAFHLEPRYGYDMSVGMQQAILTYTGAAVVFWACSIWANGASPRSDGLTYVCADYFSQCQHLNDGSGARKAAQVVFDAFRTDPAFAWSLA